MSRFCFPMHVSCLIFLCIAYVVMGLQRSCSPSELQRCVGPLQNLTNNQNFLFSLKGEPMEKECGELNSAFDCVGEYINECLQYDQSTKTRLQKFISGMGSFVRSACNPNSELHREFVKYGPCMATLNDETQACGDKMKSSLENANTAKLTESLCCALHSHYECIRDVYESKCGAGAVRLMESFLKVAYESMLESQCSLENGVPVCSTSTVRRGIDHSTSSTITVRSANDHSRGLLKGSCSPGEQSMCYWPLEMLGKNLNFPQVPPSVDLISACRERDTALTCLNDYADQCLQHDEDAKIRVKMFIPGFEKLINEACNPGSQLQQDFLGYGPCMARVNKNAEVCHKDMELSFQSSKKTTNNQNELTEATCCILQRHYHCTKNVYETGCGAGAGRIIEFTRKVMNEALYKNKCNDETSLSKCSSPFTVRPAAILFALAAIFWACQRKLF